MLEFNFTPFPVLESERLRMRRIDRSDTAAIFALRSDPDVMKYVPRPLAKTYEDAHMHIDAIEGKIVSNTGINWGITIKGRPEMIGIIGFFRLIPDHYRAEIGYMLLPEFHGRGIMAEAIKRSLEYGFNEMKLHSIEAIIDPDNTASARVLEKNNFVKEAHLRENEFFDGRFLDTVIYSILNR